MINYLSLTAFIILIALAVGRGFMLRRRGSNAFVLGVTNKSDLLLIPIVLLFFYALLSTALGFPFPKVLIKPFFTNNVAGWMGIIICYVSIVWFAMTLRSFGKSFRIGIDERSPDKLITSGMFALSRNPIFTAFIAFVVGIFLIHPNITASAAIVFFVTVIHRQILREEKFLCGHYGKEYEDYCCG
ncbi:MAG: isoprenylcysteine carboxylmethyltransferase family protein [Chitinispirillales bacterium]|nr:isoprenylcysteine carboxylmethyltransferase family protein [Chitinispirillales bacterium]